MPTPMVLRDPADVLSLVPYLLGFHPEGAAHRFETALDRLVQLTAVPERIRRREG